MTKPLLVLSALVSLGIGLVLGFFLEVMFGSRTAFLLGAPLGAAIAFYTLHRALTR